MVGTALTVTPSCAGVKNACGPVNDYTYKWLIEGLNDDGTGDDNYQPIANAESNTYTPTGTQQKRRIKAVVTNKPAGAPAPADVAAPTAKAKAKVTQ